MKTMPVFVSVLALAIITTVSHATSPFQSSANSGAQVHAAPKREIGAENTVAKLFESIRRDAKEHRLHRIEDRKDLQQLTCSVAVTGGVPRSPSGTPALGNSQFKDEGSALYRTSNPTEITPELQRIATFKVRRSLLERYSVAVWSSPNQNDRKDAYWVSIKLYYGAGNEFFLNHFTDQMGWKNEWKRFVVPQCTGVK